MTESELKEKFVDAIYTIVKECQTFVLTTSRLQRMVLTQLWTSPNNDITQEEKKKLDPLGIYTEEELSILQYTRDIPSEVKDAMSKLAQGL